MTDSGNRRFESVDYPANKIRMQSGGSDPVPSTEGEIQDRSPASMARRTAVASSAS
jgi:hypothetical protein